MTKLIVANWKSNPLTQTEAIELAKKTDKANVVICPPYHFLHQIKSGIKTAKLGAQDAFWGNLGAYTGEVSWRQLKEAGAEYVIIGHSERRNYLKETDELINNKVIACLDGGLKVILCVGESSEIRNKGINHAKQFVERQLDLDLIGLEAISSQLQANSLLIAYEPIWAIGTGKPDTPENASQMAKSIKDFLANSYKLSASVLYGGSVNSKNAAEFLGQKEIDGALVGGASINAEEFLKIIAQTK